MEPKNMFGKCFNRSGGVYSIDLINYRLLENSCIKKKQPKKEMHTNISLMKLHCIYSIENKF